MIGRRRKTFCRLHALLRAIEADLDDLELVRSMNRLLVAEILLSEEGITRHRAKARSLKAELRAARGTRAEANIIRRAIRRAERHIGIYSGQRYIWKCFGDGLAFAYLDKFSIKHAYFETESFDIKRSAGMLGGKSGLTNEMAFLDKAIDNGVPAVLCDITNILRYGDVCLLGASDPVPIEVKSGRLNQRGKRQLRALDRLNAFLQTDKAENFRTPGVTRRVTLDVSERNYQDEMNTCIENAAQAGFAIAEPEQGLLFMAAYRPPTEAELDGLNVHDGTVVCMLDEDKSAGTWSIYQPFTRSIREASHLLDFIEGRLSLTVMFDVYRLSAGLARPGWDVSVHNDVAAVIQLHHPGTGTVVGVSRQFLSRICYEFVAPSWVAESQAPKLEELGDELVAAAGPDLASAAQYEEGLRAFGFARLDSSSTQ